jgi:replication fork clamp-binding protein CrfC
MTAAGSAIVGGAAYVNYKVQEVSSYTSDKLSQATEFATELFDGAKGVVDGIVVPDFGDWFDSLKSKVHTNSKSVDSAKEVKRFNSNQNDDGDGNPKSTVAAAAAAFGGAFGLGNDSDEDGKDDQIMLLTRKMIEIRGILQQVDQSDTIQLPSIVVIGSQSSGKSSVLEAIVGHEFLPKGANMVTRRPIELTLINTPDIAAEYGEFPALGLGKITDFTQIQKTLTDLNLAVPETEAISDEPIQLRIYSPTVPDLTLIDLPGFIQVAASDQPETLKQKINLLCEKYIQSPNIILAISSADVDMANSSALKASRRIDPRGERTIGVITKMDLVDSNKGYQILHDNNYPLQMGYVGVITKAPSASLFRRTSNITSLVSQTEQAFFSQHPEFENCTVGTYSLRRKLMAVLEKTMAASLQPTSIAIRQELEEASYQFKVEYNDRILTPETYLAGSVDAFKLAFKQLNTQFGRNEVRNLLKAELDQKVLDLLAQRYWNKPMEYKDAYGVHINEHPLSELPKADPNDLYWLRKLDASTSSLTKLGIGRLSTNLVIGALTSEMKHLVDSTNFRNHPFARETIDDAVSGILNLRFYSTSDQVENCIKPYKYEVDVEDREWIKSREHSYNLLKEELRQCEDAFYKIKKTIGGHKLNQVFKFIESTRKNGPITLHEGSDMFGFSQPLIAKGREALFLRDRADIIKMRLAAIKSRQCKSKENKYYCPEIFLDVVATKLTQTAVLFLNVELLSDFYYNFPRELDNRLGTQLTHQQIEAFAKEDPKIKRHVELQQRKELLQMALNKIESVIELEKSRVREGSLSLNGNHHNDHRNPFRRGL